MHDANEIHFEFSKNRRAFEWFGIAVIVSAIALMGLTAFNFWKEAMVWNPLAEYPILIVNDPNPSNDIKVIESAHSYSDSPVFYWNEEIEYSGVKCVKADEGKVNIDGIVYWVSDLPPGRTIEIGGDISTRGPGCQQYEFTNPIPEAVLSAMKTMKAQGKESSVWHLTGVETPFKDGGERGESRSWLSTTFTVIHKDAP
jgi:hypothetical protein